MALGGTSYGGALARSLRLGGQSALVLQLLLAKLYHNVAGVAHQCRALRAAGLHSKHVGIKAQ